VINCGDGLQYPGEACDNSNQTGCSNCTVSPNFQCSGGSPTSPSVCSCLPLFKLVNTSCVEICGDGFVIGTEKCDDKEKGGCKADCLGENPGFKCEGGNSTAPSICTSTEVPVTNVSDVQAASVDSL
jgi:hypothetical protein